MTSASRRTFLYIVIVALIGIVLSVACAVVASADTCDPAYTAQCCACEPNQAAEPAPLPHLYLPSVMQRMPSMSAEYTPAQPVATPEPDVPVSGDTSQ